MSSVRSSPRGLLVLAVALAPLILGTCQNEEGRMRKQISGEYVSDIDEITGGEKRREHHVLTLGRDGLWRRSGWAMVADQRTDLWRDSGHYRIQGKTLILRSHVDEVGPLRYTITGDILHGGNAPISHTAAQLGMSQGRFIRSR